MLHTDFTVEQISSQLFCTVYGYRVFFSGEYVGVREPGGEVATNRLSCDCVRGERGTLSVDSLCGPYDHIPRVIYQRPKLKD